MSADIDTIVRLAEEDAAVAIEIARLSPEPIAWITGNSHMPPLRAFGRAEQAWIIDDEGESWDAYSEAFEHALEEAEVYLDAPEYDNSLYCVDLRRWEHIDEDGLPEGADSLDDEWAPKVMA